MIFSRRNRLYCLVLALLVTLSHAWSPFFPSPPKPKSPKPTPKKTATTTRKPPLPKPPVSNTLPLPEVELPEVDLDIPNPISPNLWNSATSSLLGFAANFAPKDVKKASNRAAHLTVNSLPPNSVEIDLRDVPIVGSALSGTYAKIKKPLSREPSIKISSPNDKIGAIQTAADTGNLEFGLNGLFQSKLEIQLQPNQPGVAPVELKSPLIPKWPFGRRKSDWSQVTNMGNGEVYYFNTKTNETTLEKPKNV